MSEIEHIYNSGPIVPVCKIKENLAVWTTNLWNYFKVDFIEGLPRSSQTVVEMITASGRTTLAANGTVPKIQLAPLLLNEGEFLHLRFEPLDDIECILWEQGSQGRFATRAIHDRVTLYSWQRDPYLAATTFFILGRDRLMNLEIRNPNPVAVFVARVVFWGYRYLVNEINMLDKAKAYHQRLNPGLSLGEMNVLADTTVTLLKAGDEQLAKAVIGPTTWLPAEGKG